MMNPLKFHLARSTLSRSVLSFECDRARHTLEQSISIFRILTVLNRVHRDRTRTSSGDLQL